MSFDALAPHYTWMERVLAGRRLQHARTAWLDHLEGRGAAAPASRVLIAGVGHGHFLASCARRWPAAEITAVDASAAMLGQARRRIERAGLNGHAIEFVHATLPTWQPPARNFDVIVTHFFLDCFAPAELGAVVAALAQAARPCACWLLADFAIPAAGWRRMRARAIHWTMYAFFRPIARVSARRVTAPDSLLRAHGFSLVRRRTTEWGLLQSDWWQRGAEQE